MTAKLVRAAVFVVIASIAIAAPKGTVPRPSVEKYALHAVRDRFSIGVVAVSPEQTRKQFVSDLNRCCVVVEVALYPGKDGKLDVSLNDLVLRQNNSTAGEKPASAKVVASKLQKKKEELDRDPTEDARNRAKILRRVARELLEIEQGARLAAGVKTKK